MSISILAVILAGYQSYQIIPGTNALQYALYETIGRIIWSIGVCYIIFACIHGSGGPINTFLSLPIWQPFAKLSYSFYLIHWTIIKIMIYSTKTPLYFNEFTAFQNLISFYVLATIVAIPLVLAFELPIDAIIRLLNAPKKKEKAVTHF